MPKGQKPPKGGYNGSKKKKTVTIGPKSGSATMTYQTPKGKVTVRKGKKKPVTIKKGK
jgi:hypothetical protein